MKRNKTAAIIFGILALGWISVLFYFSGQNGEESTSISMKVTQLILNWFPGIGMTAHALNPIMRKIAHFGIFAVEGFFTGLCLLNALKAKTGFALSVAACFLMAGANEYHQTFIEGRAGQWRDVMIDSAGAAAGILAAFILMRIIGLITGRKKNKTTSIYRDR